MYLLNRWKKSVQLTLTIEGSGLPVMKARAIRYALSIA